MFRNYIKVAFRNLIRNKTFSIINLLGLSVGIACAALIFMWVNDEINFDNFHADKDNIYRILVDRNNEGNLSAQTPGLLAKTIKDEIHEIKYAARIIQNHRNPWKYKENGYYEDRSFCVDQDFFRIFNFPIIQGETISPLDNPNSIVISESTAKKYFGDEDPIGKEINWNNWSTYQVNGIIKDMPANSHLQMEILESHLLSEKFWKGGYNWTNYVHETYILVEDNSSIPEVSKKVEEILNKHSNFEFRTYTVYLQPLDDIHLNADISESATITGDSKYIQIFSIIAFGILLIACINFINISTANSFSRAKEVGIRKVIGAQKGKLVIQFLGEFILLAIFAAIAALLIIELALPYFNQFTGKSLSLNMQVFLFSIFIIFVTALVAGSYPAFFLSSFSPYETFKNSTGLIKGKVSLRSLLVVFQFSISIILIICTILVSQQLEYIQNKKLGFDKDNIIYIPAKADLASKFDIVKAHLEQYPDIKSAAIQQSVPTTTINGSWVRWEGQIKQDLVVRNTQVTPGYFRTMNIEIKQGRVFSDKIAADKKETFVLNESAVKYLGLENPVGLRIQTAGREGHIIGIVKDSYFKSLHHEIEPLIFIGLADYRSVDLFGVVLIKFAGHDIQKLLSELESTWKKYNTHLPFEYHFLDNTIEQQYKFEMQLQTVFGWFSLLAVIISISGLLALALLLMQKRTKEIGIRKVLGASVTEITTLLTSSFVKWIIVSNIVAFPISYFLMNEWLQGYAYKIEISAWPFILSGFAALAIAVLTISFQAIKAAVANPVESLKYE